MWHKNLMKRWGISLSQRYWCCIFQQLYDFRVRSEEMNARIKGGWLRKEG
jgi:hypothetical protein